MNNQKLFIGARLKRLRRDLNITQTRMAEDMGVSASYLNLLERNQRPVTAQLLIKLAENYDVDLKDLAGESDERAIVELAEVFADPLFRDLHIPRTELKELSEMAPSTIEGITRLYRSYLDAKRREDLVQARIPDQHGASSDQSNPVERVRDIVQEHRNHFPQLDELAEQLHAELELTSGDLFSRMSERLRERFGIAVRILPLDVMSESLRRYNRHRRQLMISELMDTSGRTFSVAYQLALAEATQVLDEWVERSGEKDVQTQRLLRVNLANYFAAALLMPYGKFLQAAESLNYDIQVLGARFGASFEQVCHRLTTLSRSSARGVPFFMVRVDGAGNVSKRFAAGKFPFSKYGGTCPLWNIHATFKIPGKIFTQIIEMPDGNRYFSIARTVRRPAQSFSQSETELTVGLGCDLKYASKLIYARGYDLENPNATPIGMNCRLCERENCSQRAAPPLARTLYVDEGYRGLSPFQFDAQTG